MDQETAGISLVQPIVTRGRPLLQRQRSAGPTSLSTGSAVRSAPLVAISGTTIVRHAPFPPASSIRRAMGVSFLPTMPKTCRDARSIVSCLALPWVGYGFVAPPAESLDGGFMLA